MKKLLTTCLLLVSPLLVLNSYAACPAGFTCYELSTNNVGINTANPTATLGVGGNAEIGGTAYTNAASPPANGLIVQGNTGIGTINPGTNLDVNGTFRIENLINVGINLGNGTLPGEALDVNGTIRTTSLTVSGNNATTNYVLTSLDSAGDSTWAVAGSGSGTVSAGTVHQEAVYTGSTTVGSGIITDNGTNVGIGTVNPIEPLQVIGAAQFSGTGNVGIGSTNPGVLLDVQGTIRGNQFIASGAGVSYFNTNVGINNATPAMALDVSGTIRTTTFTMTSGNPANGYVLTATDSSGDTNWQAVTGTGTVTSVGLSTPSSTLTLGGTNPVTTSGTISADINLTHANTWTGQQLFNTKNVGINSATPGQWLDVFGTIRSTQMIDTGVTASKVVVTDANQKLTAATNLTDTAYSTAVGANPSAVVGTSAVNGSSANFIRADGAPAIDQTMVPTWTGLHTFNGSPISILTGANDNVGIGTASPGKLLDVQGTVRAIALTIRGGMSSQFLKGDGTTDSSTYLTGNQTITLSSDVTGSGTTAITTTLKSTGTAGTYRSTTFDAQGRETSGTNPTTFSGYAISDSSTNLRSALTDSTGTGANVFAVSPILTGNVGINTVTPGQVLDVTGTVRATGFSFNGTTAAGYVLTDVSGNKNLTMAPVSTGTNYWSLSAGAGNVGINTTNTVGIGTTLGSAALTVMNGNVGIGTWNPIAGLQVTTTGNAYFGGNVGIGTTNFNASLSVMGGNVGIGTWNPTSQVQIKGTCGAIGPVGACWTATGQLGYCSGISAVCTSCTAC